MFRVCCKFLRNDRVDREQQVHAAFLGFRHELFRELDAVFVEQGGTDLIAHRLEERIRHAAADDQTVAFSE